MSRGVHSTPPPSTTSKFLLPPGAGLTEIQSWRPPQQAWPHWCHSPLGSGCSARYPVSDPLEVPRLLETTHPRPTPVLGQPPALPWLWSGEPHRNQRLPHNCAPSTVMFPNSGSSEVSNSVRLAAPGCLTAYSPHQLERNTMRVSAEIFKYRLSNQGAQQAWKPGEPVLPPLCPLPAPRT